MNAPLPWLIDTNVVSEMMRPEPDPRVGTFLDSIADEGIGLASITVRKVLNGIGLLAPDRRRRDLTDRFHGLLSELFEDCIVDRTQIDACACGRNMENKRRRDEALDNRMPDAFLAAAAASRGFTVVTRKFVEFRNIGIETADSWTAGMH